MSEHDLTQVCNILARVLLLQVIHCLGGLDRRFDVLFLKKLYILSCLEKWVPIRYIRSILACPKAAKMLMRNSFICTKLPTRRQEK